MIGAVIAKIGLRGRVRDSVSQMHYRLPRPPVVHPGPLGIFGFRKKRVLEKTNDDVTP